MCAVIKRLAYPKGYFEIYSICLDKTGDAFDVPIGEK